MKNMFVIGVVIAIIAVVVIIASQGGVEVTVGSTPTPTRVPTFAPKLQSNDMQSDTLGVKQYSAVPEQFLVEGKTYFVTLSTSKGDMKIKLFSDEVPVAANNFAFLAKDGFYNGTIFHRVIKGFMIQGGDPLGTGMGDPGYKFADEPITRSYDRGIVAYANSGANTNGSQFFIMHQDYPLPPQYVIFGEVVDGFDTVDAIAESPVKVNEYGSEVSTPVDKIDITSATLSEE